MEHSIETIAEWCVSAWGYAEIDARKTTHVIPGSKQVWSPGKQKPKRREQYRQIVLYPNEVMVVGTLWRWNIMRDPTTDTLISRLWGHEFIDADDWNRILGVVQKVGPDLGVPFGMDQVYRDAMDWKRVIPGIGPKGTERLGAAEGEQDERRSGVDAGAAERGGAAASRPVFGSLPPARRGGPGGWSGGASGAKRATATRAV